MKQSLLIAALLALFNSSFACSCGTWPSFCLCNGYYDLSASCVVVDSFSHGISLRILNKFHGNENRDTINVWDNGGPYNMCNDSMLEASAGFLGHVGDTLIIALEKTDTLINSWDVIGDYHTPGFSCNEYVLRVWNSTVIGLISGSEYCYYMNNCVNIYNYDSFIVDFPIKSLSCDTWLGTKEIPPSERLSFYPNPFENTVSFSKDLQHDIVSIRVEDIVGRTVPVVFSGNTIAFPASFPPGLYIINTTLSDGNTLSNKIWKQ